MTQPRVEIKKLTDALPDPNNANEHTQRGQAQLEKSMSKRGFFRPMAAAGKGVEKPIIKAGNLTQETAIALGMDEAIFIYTDGSRPIVHVRTDLDVDGEDATLLALEDNRIAQLSLNWKPDVLGLQAEQLDLSGLFTTPELKAIVGDDGEGAEDQTIPEQFAIMIECNSEQEQIELLNRFSEEGIKCRALIS